MWPLVEIARLATARTTVLHPPIESASRKPPKNQLTHIVLSGQRPIWACLKPLRDVRHSLRIRLGQFVRRRGRHTSNAVSASSDRTLTEP